MNKDKLYNEFESSSVNFNEVKPEYEPNEKKVDGRVVLKENFKPSKFLNKPKVNVCLWALASDDDDKAEYLFSSRAYWKIARNYGELDTLKSPKDALSKLNDNNWMSFKYG